MAAYYNEIDPFAAAWLRELIKAGLIADGEVDERSIADVTAGDVRGFIQCHWFAGIGGWSYALRLAGWPDTRDCWTGSCPCQPVSSATRGRSVAVDHWPEWKSLIAAKRPHILFGEQVAHRGWFDGVCDDLEALDYAVGAAVLPACCVDLDHTRPRLFFVGHTNRDGESSRTLNAEVDRVPWHRCLSGDMVPAHGFSRDMVALSGFGNAIAPSVAAEFIKAYEESRVALPNVIPMHARRGR